MTDITRSIYTAVVDVLGYNREHMGNDILFLNFTEKISLHYWSIKNRFYD